MTVDIAKILRKIEIEHREWIDEPSIIRSAEREIEDQLSSDEILELAKDLHLDLSPAAAWYWHKALVCLMDGKASGWSEYERSLRFMSHSPCIRIPLYSYLSKKGDPYKKPTCFGYGTNMVAALALRDESAIALLGEYFLKEGTEHDLTFDMFGERRPEFNALPYWLYAKWSGCDWDKLVADRFPNATLGSYQTLHDRWGEGDNFEEAVVAMLDYHLERIYNPKRDYGYEFESKPFSLFPTEYFALRNVRRKLGLDTPKPEHPLLEPPFGDPPDPLPRGEGTIFDEAIWRVKQAFPEIYPDF